MLRTALLGFALTLGVCALPAPCGAVSASGVVGTVGVSAVEPEPDGDPGVDSEVVLAVLADPTIKVGEWKNYKCVDAAQNGGCPPGVQRDENQNVGGCTIYLNMLGCFGQCHICSGDTTASGNICVPSPDQLCTFSAGGTLKCGVTSYQDCTYNPQLPTAGKNGCGCKGRVTTSSDPCNSRQCL